MKNSSVFSLQSSVRSLSYLSLIILSFTILFCQCTKDNEVETNTNIDNISKVSIRNVTQDPCRPMTLPELVSLSEALELFNSEVIGIDLNGQEFTAYRDVEGKLIFLKAAIPINGDRIIGLIPALMTTQQLASPSIQELLIIKNNLINGNDLNNLTSAISSNTSINIVNNTLNLVNNDGLYDDLFSLMNHDCSQDFIMRSLFYYGISELYVSPWIESVDACEDICIVQCLNPIGVMPTFLDKVSHLPDNNTSVLSAKAHFITSVLRSNSEETEWIESQVSNTTKAYSFLHRYYENYYCTYTSRVEAEYMATALNAVRSNSGYILDRFIDLYDLLHDNPHALIEDCISKNPNLDINDYFELFNFDIPPSTQQRLDDLGSGFKNQPIEDGNVATTNVDYYGIEITTLPDLDGDGVAESMEEVFEAIRLEFPNIASGSKTNFQPKCDVSSFDLSWSFFPYWDAELDRWLSSNPLNSIFKIEGKATGWANNLAADNGAIIVSDIQECCWTVSSIFTPFSNTQPFSGNRQWGYFVNDNGNMEVFTKAIDVAHINWWSRVGIVIPFMGVDWNCSVDSYYDIAKVTWESFQGDVKTFIEENPHNGAATVLSPQIEYLANAAIAIFLRSNVPVTNINCQ